MKNFSNILNNVGYMVARHPTVSVFVSVSVRPTDNECQGESEVTEPPTTLNNALLDGVGVSEREWGRASEASEDPTHDR